MKPRRKKRKKKPRNRKKPKSKSKKNPNPRVNMKESLRMNCKIMNKQELEKQIQELKELLQNNQD
jgi:hypothetical protein